MLFTIKQAILEFGKCATGSWRAGHCSTNNQVNSSVTELIQLEDRVLYSASPIEIQEPAIQIDGDPGFEGLLDSTANHDNEIASLLSYSGDSSYVPLNDLEPASELIIVDPNVDGYQELVEGIVSSSDRSFELVFLQQDADGVEQITQLLLQYSNLDAIHLVSHGSEGSVQLGNVRLSMDSMAGYASDIASWSSALSSNADLLFYGCDLASNEDGETLIEAISELTDADVAASEDLTGHARLGANWTLEFATGQIEADVVFDQQVQQAWYSVLAVTASTDTYSTGENTILNESAASGVLDNDIEAVGPVATVTLGAILNYDASLDVTSNGLWEETNGNSTFDWALDPAVTLDSSPTNAPPGITAAYNFDGSSLGLISTPFESMTGDEPTDESVTFEIWFRTDSPSDRRGVLFDSGNGTDGTNLRLYQDGGDTYIEFLIVQGATDQVAVTANITSEVSSGDFIQVAGNFNVISGTAELFVNGVLIGSDTNALVSDWSGNAAGIGLGDNDLGFAFQNDPHVEGLNGQIAVFRVYDSALSTAQIQANYDAITTAPSGGGLNVTSFDATSVAGAAVNVNADGSFTYDPGTLFDYLKDGESVIDTFTYTAEDGSSNTDVETVSITINGLTEAPTGITPTSFNVNENEESGGGYSVGTMSAIDEDAGETFVYSIVGGADQANFSIGGSNLDELILANGILDFESQASYTVDIRVSDSGGNDFDQTLTVNIDDVNEAAALWFATGGDVSDSGGVDNLSSWGNDDILQLADPDLAFGSGTDDGTISRVFGFNVLPAIDDGDLNVNAVHYVSTHISVGTTDTFDLRPGDVIFSVSSDEDFYGGTLRIERQDVGWFRPDTIGDYTSGTFGMLLDDLSVGGFVGPNVEGITLVEQTTTVGDVILQAGDFLFTQLSDFKANNIFWFQTTDVGEGTTDGSTVTLIDGDDIGLSVISSFIHGIELVETETVIGGETLSAGTILIQSTGSHSNVGDGNISTTEYDIIALDASFTTHGNGTAFVDASIFVQGSDLLLNTGQKEFNAFSFAPEAIEAPNVDPNSDAGGPYIINEGDSLFIDGSGSSDSDGTIAGYSWDLNDDGTFGDVITATANIDWSDLVAFWGINDGDVGGRDYDIHLQVIDNLGDIGESSAVVTVHDVSPNLFTTGSGSVEAGSLYTLTLSSSDFGDDLISDWIIDWGDGTVNSPGGNPATWSHTYLEAGNYDITAAVIDEDGTHLQNDLLVTGYNSSTTYTFDSNTGQLLDTFSRSGQDVNIEVGPDGKLYVTSFGSNVQRFLIDGTPDGTFASGNGMSGADGLVFGPDGNLYVASYQTDVIKRFDGTTGAFIDDFTVGGNLDGPSNLTFGPDGNLYVSSGVSGEILRYDGRTGVFIDVFASGLTQPEALLFSPDGDLYVSSRGSDQVIRLDATTGAILGILADVNLDDPYGLAFGTDGMLYVTGFESDNIVRFDVDSETYDGEIVASAPSGLDAPTYLHFLPGNQVAVSPGTGISDAIWLSTQDDVTASGTDGIADWTNGMVLQIGDPNFALEDMGTTGGTFSSVVNLDGFADGDVEIQGMHYVTSDIWIGGDDSVQLFAGDILFSVNNTESFDGTGANSLVVQDSDIFIFRPDVAGNYGAGTFELLMDNMAGAKLHAFTLVEQDTLVGDTIVRAGDFLYATSGGSVHDQIWWYQTTGAGQSLETTGTPALLIDGNDLGFSGNQIQGIDLVESSMTVGEHDLNVGQILMTLNNTASVGGTSVTDYDIFYVTMSATNYGSPTAVGTADLLLEGLDVDLEAPASEEDIHALTLVAAAINTAPTDISPDTFNLAEGTDTSTGVNLATLTATDPDDSSFTYAMVGGADIANFSLAGAGDELVFTAGILNHETQDVYSVVIRATDSVGNNYDETIYVNVDDINDPPTMADQPFTIDEGLSNGNVVGSIIATDVDDGVNGDLSFSLTGGTGATAFAVDAAGQITVVDASQLDFETALLPFTLDVQVSDNGTPGLSDTATITINLNDVQNFLVVDTISDEVDGDVDSIGELLADMGADGAISLREAILATNNTLNDGITPDEIRFAILGGGVQTIAMTGDRMEITDAVYLNATTQFDYTYDTPMIEIDGSGITGVEQDIFWITGGGTTVRGFVLNNAGDDAIDIEFGDGNTIVGNFIGTDATGTSAAGNEWGIAVKSNNNVIGGATDADRNIISGNNDDGIIIHESNDNGGYFPPTGNQILGNLIGANLNGDALGNGDHGIMLQEDASANQIGGIFVGEGNVIANNGGDGVSLNGAGDQNSILGNLIYDNGMRGIDLGNDGVTPNNTPGPGPNDFQNYPDLVSATTDGASLITVNGSLNAANSTDYRIEFFASSSGDDMLHGEAEMYLGFVNVTTDPTGTVSFSQGLPVAVPVGYVITATATDDLGSTSEFSLNVTATTSNLPPTAITTNAFSIDENTDTSSGHSFGVLGVADPNPGDTFTFQVLTGLDSAKFSIGGTNSDELVLDDGILDHETQDTYFVLVRVEDSAGNQHDELITVTVDDVNETPTAIAPTSFNVSENTNTVSGYSLGTLGVTDEDDSETFSYTIEGGADEFSFSIGGTGSNELIIDDGILDHEMQDSYSVLVRVEDSGGNQYDELITVAIDDVNETPTAITPTSYNIVENTDSTTGISLGTLGATDEDDGETFIYTVAGGADQSSFSIGGIGSNELIISDGILNHESQDTYFVLVRAEDSAGNQYDELITVTIGDVNEAPTAITPTILGVSENTDTTSGYSLGALGNNDLDDGETFVYTIEGGADELRFSIGGAGSNELIFDDGILDHETKDIYSVIVRVEDSAGHQYDETITVNVNDVNEAPTAITPNGLNLNEHIDTTGGYSLGLMAVTDVDDGDSFTYTLVGGVDVGVFSIGGGNELFIDAGILNHESISSYSVDVQVEDSAGNTFVQSIAVVIDDQNDDPVITTSTLSIVENSNVVGMVAATDDDVPADTLTFSIAGSGADDSHFEIDSATGELSFILAPDFEAATDAGNDNIYNVDILVADGAGGSSVNTLAVSVLNENERPTAGLLPKLVVNEDAANQVLNLQLIFEDQEDDDSSLVYSIENVSNTAPFDSVSIDASDQLILDFAANQHGSTLITIRATDSGGRFVEAIYRVSILPVNDDPVVVAPVGSVVVDEDAANTIIDLSTVFDDVDIVTDGDSLTYSVDSNSNPLLVDVGLKRGMLRFDYQDDQAGTSTIVVMATDAAGRSVTETISLTVNPVDDPTIVVDDSFQASGVDPIIISPSMLLINDSDIDSKNLTVVPVSGSEIGGVLSVDGLGNLVFTPGVLTAGVVSFDYVVVAGSETSLPGTVSINLVGGSETKGDDPPAEEPEEESVAADPPTDPVGGTTETGPEDPVVSGNDNNSDSADNLADTVSNGASSFEIQNDDSVLRNAGTTASYAYADNQQLQDLVFQLATTNLNEKLVLSTFDSTFIANVFWDELDNANRDYLVNNLEIGIPKMVASTASFLTVGYLAWIIRGGVLMTTVMTSLPAWRSLDIVPIIESANAGEEDDESIEQMVDN